MPPALDLTDCPYMWPYCKQACRRCGELARAAALTETGSYQAVYCTSMPHIVNITLISGLGAEGQVVHHPEWRSDSDSLTVHTLAAVTANYSY